MQEDFKNMSGGFGNLQMENPKNTVDIDDMVLSADENISEDEAN